jgi:toxin-antitoxin system PIN domain toxin
MQLPDVNVLIYAHRREALEHEAYAEWLTQVAQSQEPFALSELVGSAFLRIVTNPKAFSPPTSLPDATEFIDRLMRRSNCRVLRPGPRNWRIFKQLCENSNAHGKLIADAYHAALAIEHGCEWITNDADFSRFEGLRWRHPLRVRG